MVPGGGRYKATCEFIRAKLRYEIDATSGFERAEDLVILVLNPELRARSDETS
jgi:hypothetical protein